MTTFAVMNKKVRVRFAPSPTGGLHLGGVRTVLYNYLFARASGGDFVLRIEDTDQNRFVAGAEEYIYECLDWCGLSPDESTHKGGPFAPYRQSERKSIYATYAMKLVESGHAYYAFDTPEAIEKMRTDYRKDEHSPAQYDHNTRMFMNNALSLTKEEVQFLLGKGTPYVIRIKMPQERHITFTDMIRGEITFDCGHVDDKVLLKADGMPTYHLAVVVDDYLMQITHAFRGEEWLPSAPVHLLLWEYLGWKEQMPQWAHLPLILKPEGNGKCDTLLPDSSSTVKTSQGFVNSTLTFDTSGTTSLVNMNMTLRDSLGLVNMMFSITLGNLTANGSTFSIEPTAINGLHFSGTGTISATVATLSLTAIADTSLNHGHDSAITITYSCPNYLVK